MKEILKKCFIVCTLNLIIGIVIVIISIGFLRSEGFTLGFDGTIPSSFHTILINNTLCAAMYAIPFIGVIFYVFSFFYTYIVIGASISQSNLFQTLSLLVHMPLEMLGLTLPLYTFTKSKPLLTRSKTMSLSLILILVASIIEINLRSFV